MEKEERPNLEKYDRREFLKSSAKTGLIVGSYATLGGLVGKGYQTIKDYFNNTISYLGNKMADLDDKVEKMPNTNPVKIADNASKEVNSWYTRLFNRTPQQQEEWRKKHNIKTPEYIKESLEAKSNEPNNYEEKQEVTRRGFFKALLGIANKHPVATGASIGAAYGAGKATVGSYKNKNLKKLERQNIVLQQGIYDLKQNDLKQKSKKENYEKVTNEIEQEADMQQSQILQGGLEKSLLILGMLGLFFSMLFSLATITGNAIYELNKTNNPIISVVVFIVSLVIIFISRKI